MRGWSKESFLKNLNEKVNATLPMGLENIDLKQYQPHPKWPDITDESTISLQWYTPMDFPTE